MSSRVETAKLPASAEVIPLVGMGGSTVQGIQGQNELLN
jgi:hypothetical protein